MIRQLVKKRMQASPERQAAGDYEEIASAPEIEDVSAAIDEAAQNIVPSMQSDEEIALSILISARSILDEKYINGASATDCHGSPVLPEDSRAVGFCAVGAMQRARFDFDKSHTMETAGALARAYELLGIIAAERTGYSPSTCAIMAVNDKYGKFAILGCFDRAIGALSKKLSEEKR